MTQTLEVPSSIPSDFDWQRPDYARIFHARLDRLTRLRAQPELIPGLKAYYKDHLVAFVQDWGITYDPRNVEIGLPTLMPFVLFPRQIDFLQWLYARWQARQGGLVEKSRDMGVSWLCIAFSVWVWLFYAGASIGFGSRKEEYVDDLNNPNALFWKARTLIDYVPVEFRPKGWDTKKHAPYMKLINPENGATMIGEAGDNIGRGARSSLYFVDEAAFLEHQDSIDAALSQTTNCKIDVSTPNGAGNAFYRKRHGGKIETFIFDWKDDPRKDQAWYDAQVAKLDAVVVAAEIDRNYEGSVPNALIPGEFVRDAMKRGPADTPAIGGLRVGVDVARNGPDKCAITFRRGRVVLKLILFGKSEIPDTAARVRQEILAYGEIPEQIAVDTCGMGCGVADLLRGWYPDRVDPRTGRIQQIVADVNSSVRMDNGQHYNLRAFMWSELREWLKSGSIPNDPTLQVDLTSIRYTFKGGQMLLEDKDKAKARGVKSPDAGDSLALTFAIPTIPHPSAPKLPAYAVHDMGMGALGAALLCIVNIVTGGIVL